MAVLGNLPVQQSVPTSRMLVEMITCHEGWAVCTGEGEVRSVEGQVQQLLQDAQDPDKLCKMYVGWAAWM